MHRELDLVDQINYQQARSDVMAVFSSVDDDVKLAVCRDLIIDQISSTIEKFPLHTQKEILAILTDKYLRKWKA